ncbi:tRNA (adenine(58)-N(1))-methyltransferase non-catalytic subunit trm6 [Arthrobotrys musiformis]|uniref:tRNA (adenine(58)-N(1))-methyltransferase non-catalytic subunit TRM6 n=1 Tax=Arthrobotrys musiformis TaxID=47236 RepID=A0AAV9W5R4_9PEZI
MELIQPNDEVLIQLPSETTKLVKIVPDSIIGLGKFGSFPANSLLGRPYYLTWNILDGENFGLEPVPISELNSEKLATHTAPATTAAAASDPAKASKKSKGAATDSSTPSGVDSPGLALEDTAIGVQVDNAGSGDDEDVALDAGMLELELEREQKLWEAEMKNNRDIRDDQTAQSMTWQEIEKLKKSGGTGSGKEIITRLLQSHAHIDKKTAFSLAKYTKRKTDKYLKRIRVIPADLPNFTNYLIAQKEPLKILEIRDEAMGLMMSWADVKWGGRYLVIDDTGGLVVAAMAERMGLLAGEDARAPKKVSSARKRKRDETDDGKDAKEEEESAPVPQTESSEAPETSEAAATQKESTDDHTYNTPIKPKTGYEQTTIPASNTITVLHTQDQPNLSLLRPFNFDTANLINTTTHPLSTHLLSLSYLQLLSPESDVTLERPPVIPDTVLRALKSVKRSNYHRKCRRQERLLNIVSSTRRGGFDGAIIATGMELSGVINTVTPLLKGSGQLVIYSPSVEPLSEVVDWCSTLRRTEYMRVKKESETTTAPSVPQQPLLHTLDPENTNPDIDQNTLETLKSLPKLPAHTSDEYFPIDPTNLLAPTIHTSRVRTFQALPGRTHPLMTSRGGSEGYILHATKVFPILEGKVEARGKFGSKKKGGGGDRSGGGGGKKEKGKGKSAELNGKKEDVMEVDNTN